MTGTEALTLAEKAFAAQDFDQTIEHAQAALSLGLDVGAYDSERGEYAPKEQSSRAEQLLAMALLERGDPDAALEHATRGIDWAREDKRAWANRGHLRRERGELDLALADLDHALSLDHRYAFARYRRAQCLRALGRLQEAERDLAQILIRDPLDAAPLSTWQEIRAQRGLSAELAALPEPQDFTGLLERAVVFAQQRGELARALADYDAAIALNADPYAILNRGLTHRALGNLERARADIAAWVKFDPQWSQVVAQLDEQIAARSK